MFVLTLARYLHVAYVAYIYIYQLLNTCTTPRNVDVLVTEPFTIKNNFTTHDFVLYQNLGFPSIFVLKNIISLAAFPP